MATTENPIVITVEEFRTDYPEFVNPPYTDAVIQRFIGVANCYVSNLNYGCVDGDCRKTVLELMIAHLLCIWNKVQTNGGGIGSNSAMGFSQKAKIGEVEISLALPTIYSLYQAWINSTMYGQQLYAMLMAHAATVRYVGGHRNRLFWTH